MKKARFILPVLLLWATMISAEPAVSVSGYILADFNQYINDEGKYSIVLDGTDYKAEGPESFDEFRITRVYLTFKADWNERLSTNVTTDVKTDTDGFRRLYLKYGYVDIKNLWPNSTVRFGLQDPPWGAYIDNELSRYRMIDSAFYNFWGFFSTADFGLGVLGSAFDDHFKYHLAVLNGEGYGGIETDRFKEYVGRLTFDFGSADTFRIYPSIGYSTHRYNDDDNFKDDVMMAGLGIDFLSRFHIAGEYLQGTLTMPAGSYPLVRGVWPSGATDMIAATAGPDDGVLTEDKDVRYGGYAVYLDIKLVDKLNLFGRYDQYDPNMDSDYDRDGEYMATGGICYHPWDPIWITLDYRQIGYQEPDPDNDGKDELKPQQIIFTHWKIAY